MRKYFVKLTAYLLLLILPLIAIFAYVQSKPAVFSKSLLGTINHKYQLLEEIDSLELLSVARQKVVECVLPQAVDLNGIHLRAIGQLINFITGKSFAFACQIEALWPSV